MPEGFAPLELEGHRGQPLPCLLHTAGHGTGIAVVLPGRSMYGGRVGGTPARPDLAYTSALLRSFGLAVLEVWWRADELRGAPDRDGWLRNNALAAFAAAAERAPLRVVAARSLGTMALAHALDAVEAAATIWIAPLLREPGVAPAIEAAGAGAFVIVGAADPQWDPDAGERLRRSGAGVHVVPRADHALQVADPAESARLMADALDELRVFLYPIVSEGVLR